MGALAPLALACGRPWKLVGTMTDVRLERCWCDRNMTYAVHEMAILYCYSLEVITMKVTTLVMWLIPIFVWLWQFIIAKYSIILTVVWTLWVFSIYYKYYMPSSSSSSSSSLTLCQQNNAGWADKPAIDDFFGGFAGDCAFSWNSAFNGEFASRGALFKHIH